MKNKKGIMKMLVLFIGLAFLIVNHVIADNDKTVKNEQKVEKQVEQENPQGETNISEKQQDEIVQKTAENKIEKENNDKKTDGNTSLLKLFELGGPFMWPLLIFSIIVLGVILERTFVFASHRFNVSKVTGKAISYVKQGNYDGASQYCSSIKRNIVSGIFCKSIPTLKKKGIKEFEKSVEASSGVKISFFERNLNILSSMGNIAPLTGFLGTVSGMITAFKTIALSDNVTARLVAGGIYEALITTAFGLIIAIIAVAGNNFFVHKIDTAANQIEESANLMIESVSER